MSKKSATDRSLSRLTPRLVYAALLFSLAGCSAPAKKPKPIPLIETQTLDRGILEAVGLGVPRPEETETEARKNSAIERAVRMARQELESIAMGQMLDNGMYLRDLSARDENLRGQLQKVLEKSEVVQQNWTRDQGCMVRLRIAKKRIEKKLKLKFR